MAVVYSNAFGGVLYENRNGVVSKYVRDTQGSTIGLTNSSGTLTDRWVYWPFGEVASRTGTNPTPLTFLGVLGYFQDVLSKLYYVRARHLRADLARWLTVDPLWPVEPPYLYANGTPTLRTDPAGTKPTPCHGVIQFVVPYNVNPYIKCLKALGPFPNPQQIAECLDSLPNSLKSELTQALCNYVACITVSQGGLPVDPCTDPSSDAIYCCWEKYESDICQCVGKYSNNINLGACLGLAYNRAVICAEGWL